MMKIFYPCFLVTLNLFFSMRGVSQGDECSTALVLTDVTNFCSSGAIYTNDGATASTLANATCWSTSSANKDVWFSFTATGTDILISINGWGYGGTIVNPNIALYSGACTSTLSQVGCTNSTIGSGYAQLYKGGLILGQTYFIRISSTSAEQGSFKLCVDNYIPPPSASADCGGAGKLCNKNGLSVNALNGGGANPNEPENTTCMIGFFTDAEANSVWYTWTCQNAGTLTFDITPTNPTNDVDFLLYQLDTQDPCGGRTPIRCNASACLNATGSTGLSATDMDMTEDANCDPGENAYCQQVNMIAGTSYALLINNANGNTGFNISWGGTGTFVGPDPNIVATDTTICVGDSVTFNGSTSTNYSALNWTFNNTGSPTSATGTGPYTITFPNPGIYTAILKATDLNCVSVEYVHVDVGAKPDITALSPTITCITPSVTISTTIIPSSGVTYTWTGTGVSGLHTGAVMVNQPGIYTVAVTNTATGCANTQTVIVAKDDIIAAFNANPTSGTAPLLVNFTDQSTGVTDYSWNFGDNNNNSSSNPNPDHTYNAIGVYTVTLIGTKGSCSDTAYAYINVLGIIVPNVFSPNGDGVNDLFKIIAVGMESYTCDIFNRWGTKIYTSKSVNDSWNGSGASDGTYFYILTCKGIDGKDYTKQGHLNLFR